MITTQERAAFHYNSNRNKIKMEAFAYTLNKKMQLKRKKKSHCVQIPGIPSQESPSLAVGVLQPAFLTLTQLMTHILESKRRALCRGSSAPCRVSRVVGRQCQLWFVEYWYYLVLNTLWSCIIPWHAVSFTAHQNVRPGEGVDASRAWLPDPELLSLLTGAVGCGHQGKAAFLDMGFWRVALFTFRCREL